MSALREGFTTGSCAAACALASCLWQRDSTCPLHVELTTPDGRTYAPEIRPKEAFACAVMKDSGDDPDITNGCEVWARAEVMDEDGPVCFRAGEGVGVITRPGLKLPVGEAAINPVPREMIRQAVRSVFPRQAIEVTVGITGGRALALKTFNPRLGVEGGLSILGTTGVVRPMSEDALVETIRLELSMRRAGGTDTVALVFGSQGEAALARLYPEMPSVQISNFVGEALSAAADLGFGRVLLAGQPGKLVKVAGGSMQTHSRYGDGRRETLIAHLARMRAPISLLEAVWASTTLDGVIAEIGEAGYARVWERLCREASAYGMARVRGALPVDTMMLDAQGRVLGAYRVPDGEEERP